MARALIINFWVGPFGTWSFIKYPMPYLNRRKLKKWQHRIRVDNFVSRGPYSKNKGIIVDLPNLISVIQSLLRK